MPGLLEADKWRRYSRLYAFWELGQDELQAHSLVSPADRQESEERVISGSFEEHLPLGVKESRYQAGFGLLELASRRGLGSLPVLLTPGIRHAVIATPKSLRRAVAKERSWGLLVGYAVN